MAQARPARGWSKARFEQTHTRRLRQARRKAAAIYLLDADFDRRDCSRGDVETELSADGDGWLTLKLGELDQQIKLRGAPRRFGGFQWYFLCPATRRPVSVLWSPPGAKRFQSRQACGRQVAYGSQFDTPSNRAFSRAEEIRNRLSGRDFVTPDGSAPPKPKGMHWRRYGALLERCDAYELKCDLYLVGLAARLKKQGI
jgi:hypothetical protein